MFVGRIGIRRQFPNQIWVGFSVNVGFYCHLHYGETSNEAFFKGQTHFYHSVDGGLTAWDDWTSCSRSCGVGQEERRRHCTNPAPQYGGTDCDDILRKLRDCEIAQCPGLCSTCNP